MLTKVVFSADERPSLSLILEKKKKVEQLILIIFAVKVASKKQRN